MRSIAVALVFAALLVLQISLRTAGIDPLVVAPVSVVLGISAALVAQGGINWIGVGCGAGSSLALGWLDGWSPIVAVGLMCTLWLAPRAWLARTRADFVLAAITALGAAGLASVVVVRYASAPMVMFVAACVFAGAALAMATLAGRIDSPLLHALRVSARAAKGPARELLDKAVVLMAQRDDSASNGPSRSVRQAMARKVTRIADQLIAQQDFEGQEAIGARAELQARLRAALQELDSGKATAPVVASAAVEPRSPPTAAASAPPDPAPSQPSEPLVHTQVADAPCELPAVESKAVVADSHN